MRVLKALTATLLVAASGGALLWALDLMVFAAGVEVLSHLSVVPLQWGEAHRGLEAVAAVAALPPTAWFAARLFRRTCKGERNPRPSGPGVVSARQRRPA